MRAGPPNHALVRIVNGPLVAPVLSRVVAMLAARADCPVDKLDDALLVADAISAHAPGHSENGHVTVDVRSADSSLELRVQALRSAGGEGLRAATKLPGVGDVLDQLADKVWVETEGSGGETLVVKLAIA